MAASGCEKIHDIRVFSCVAVDAMYLINKMTPKPVWIQNGRDLASNFCRRVNEITGGASHVIVAFDTYQNESLKKATREKLQYAKGGKVSRQYDIEETTNITTISMKEILAHSSIKSSLRKLLMKALKDHLDDRHVDLVIAGNGLTFKSWGPQDENNHEEADSLLIHCLCISPLSYF